MADAARPVQPPLAIRVSPDPEEPGRHLRTRLRRRVAKHGDDPRLAAGAKRHIERLLGAVRVEMHDRPALQAAAVDQLVHNITRL